MATTKKSAKKAPAKGSKGTGSSGKAYQKTSRCWPGFVPVPGKGEHEEGSCRKEPASKNGGKEVDREVARKKQISMGGRRAEQAKSKSPNAAERKTVSKAAKAHRSAKPASGKARGAKSAAKGSSAAGFKKVAPVKRSAKEVS